MLFTTVLFYVLALVMVVAAYRVIAAKNPVTAVLHLILVFFTAAMLNSLKLWTSKDRS